MKRAMFAVLALLLLVGLGLTIWLKRRAAAPAPVLPARMAWTTHASSSVTFVLDPTHRLEYSVPNTPGHLRLLFNANLKPEVLAEGLAEAEPRRQRPFRVEIEELDTWGRSMKKQEWAFLAQVEVFRDPEQGDLRSTLFYLDRDWIPSNTCEVQVEIKAPRRLRTLKLRLLQADPDIHDLIVRAYSPSTASNTLQAHGWERLADPIRAQLMSGNVYPEGILRDQEKRNLLAKPWQPLAPNSSWGPRPLQREVYQVLAPMDPEVGAAYEPQGLRVDPTRLSVFHLPMAGGRIRLKATAWGPLPEASTKPFLNLHWVGPGLGNRHSRRVPWPDTELDLEIPYAGGYLIAEANRLGYLRAWLKGTGEDLEITPPPDALRCVLLDAGQEVTFELPPPEGGPLAFRLDLRQIQKEPDPRTVRTWLYRDQISARWPLLKRDASPVFFEALDGQGKVLLRSRLPQDSWLSPLEELPVSFRPSRVSLPASTALLLPAAARRIRVRLEPDPTAPPPPSVLVAAYNRPQKLPRLRVLPDDFYRYDTRETRLPEWFGLDPEKLDDLVRAKRWISLRTHNLPDAQEEGLLSGLYEVDPLEPLEGLLARELLVARSQTGLVPREDGLSSYFRELRPETEATLRLQARPGLQAIRPTLLRIGPPQAASLTVEWDGRIIQRMGLDSAIQETLLPPLAPGTHRVKLRTGGEGRFFLNHQWPEAQDWTRRLAYACRPGQTLAFLHTRADHRPESLTLGYSTAAGAGSEVVLRLRVLGGGPAVSSLQPSLTRSDRRFRVRTLPGQTAFLLLDQGSSLGMAPFASVSLGPDLPPGRYRVECTVESGPAGYLTLSRSQAGLRAKTRMDQESLLGGTP